MIGLNTFFHLNYNDLMFFDLFIQRMGLEPEEAKLVDDLTSSAQNIQSWTQIQARYKAAGFSGRLVKGEAAIALINSTIETSSITDEENLLILLKALTAIIGFQYQQYLPDFLVTYLKRPELHTKVLHLIPPNEEMLKQQFNKSLDLFENRGWFEKIFG